jgi:tol-pal system protein YbgF
MRPSVIKGMVVALAAGLAMLANAQTSTPLLQMGEQAALPAGSASELLYMLEQNRQEISELRGLVEQLTFEVQQIKKQSKERYIDLDRRLLEVSEGRTSPGSSVTLPSSSAAVGAPVVAGGSVAAGGSIIGGASSESEAVATGAPASAEATKAYNAAYQYIKDREYEKAVDALHAFINQYPESDLTPNAYYWLGEVYLVLPKLEQAKQAFIVVVSKYAGHRKAPDAFFKLGVTYDRLGSPKEAETFLKQTVSRFPGTTPANLAQEYLKKFK